MLIAFCASVTTPVQYPGLGSCLAACITGPLTAICVIGFFHTGYGEDNTATNTANRNAITEAVQRNYGATITDFRTPVSPARVQILQTDQQWNTIVVTGHTTYKCILYTTSQPDTAVPFCDGTALPRLTPAP